MIWSAVLPGAALRVMRTAAGRRALHVALLVGGLFVLGLLCGERAHAADGAPSLRDTVRQVVDVPVKRPAPEARESAQLPPEDALLAVGDVVEKTTERLPLLSAADAASGFSDPALSAPALSVPALSVPGFTDPGSSDPSVPAWPSLPPLPELPDPSGADGSDGWADPYLPDDRRSDPAGADDSAHPSDGAGTPDASEATEPRTTTTGTGTGLDATDHAAHIGPAPAQAPVAVGTGARPPVTHSGNPRRTPPAHTDHAPTRHAPAGAPDGSLGTAAGADQGMPRHGDAHAVTPQHRIPFRLVPEVLERADAGEIRDPYRDIPVSPA
ncbi:hypothetical protein ACGF3J_05250 [Streptomyces sp. NPDC048171]|uniref:hypothetical protein n=1 Tax=unclassified Streptomyces TaxID=2593676 RepID=UPI001370DAC8|nr:hypothetical protein [Streptomyces sp. SID5789]MZE69247.1 hypothetical protein [Streptomyces sp. SID5789]